MSCWGLEIVSVVVLGLHSDVCLFTLEISSLSETVCKQVGCPLAREDQGTFL